MSKQSHTPGPWKAKPYKRSNSCYVTVGGRIIFEDISDETEGVTPNAYLIAAAPEMLDLLKRLDQGMSAEYLKSLIQGVIAKAEGQG